MQKPKKPAMTTEQRGKLISQIVFELRLAAENGGADFCEGDTFFSLAFRTDEQLHTVAKLCGVKT